MSDFNFEGKDYNLEDINNQARILVSRLTQVQADKEKVAGELDIYVAAEAKLLEMLRTALADEETEETT